MGFAGGICRKDTLRRVPLQIGCAEFGFHGGGADPVQVAALDKGRKDKAVIAGIGR